MPIYLQVVDSQPALTKWQPYGTWEVPQELPVDVFWKIVSHTVDAMTEYMQSVGVPVERLTWTVSVSLLTYDEMYDSIPD